MGAIFTPGALAQDFANFHLDGTRIVDLCSLGGVLKTALGQAAADIKAHRAAA
ncbi:hypothetical protein [Streptomyces sp. AP-93]|uniref:hypothetical protein n=1 Tax=Streptomyces sp. AP-93 TaxID=2929048 RepID=UPI001FAE86BA|nr:hypothetical protein [Streptomyces sp. AP-93]MCJ0875621.1 hypothetical protein [Streptomyces sp. AP-93]